MPLTDYEPFATGVHGAMVDATTYRIFLDGNTAIPTGLMQDVNAEVRRRKEVIIVDKKSGKKEKSQYDELLKRVGEVREDDGTWP